MSKQNERSVEVKLAIVIEGLKGQTPVSQICTKYGIHQSVYYKWRDKFLEGGKNALNGSKAQQNLANDSRIAELERFLGIKTAELEILKKNRI